MCSGDVFRMGSGTYRITQHPKDNSEHRLRAEVTLIPSSTSLPNHCHPACEETCAVKKGKLHVTFEEREITIGEGESYTVPRGVGHVVRNPTNDTVEFTWTSAPALGLDELVEKTSALGRAAAGFNAIFYLEEYLLDSLAGKTTSARDALSQVGETIDMAGGLAALSAAARVLAEHKTVMAGMAPVAVREQLLDMLASLPVDQSKT
ncbi:hypothetical protein EDD36DRAFT_43091 [Exophiala viscosa]|uniref:Cupin type-2 domain-containing protein n=1 Tax=Exophiala viscosa TaxID=2486360 RepID=A0AAN6E795_9EURO|nr:hypothetical protein EDD36DRAFT_43091 [Exophiala viscosa]